MAAMHIVASRSLTLSAKEKIWWKKNRKEEEELAFSLCLPRYSFSSSFSFSSYIETGESQLQHEAKEKNQKWNECERSNKKGNEKKNDK